MDSKAIETLSVNEVRNSIVISDFLDQFIPDNDKEPSWDGFVYVYNKKGKKKSDLRGRVPVQVKGTQKNDFTKASITHPVCVTDLKNYLSDGGIIYFVVYVSKDGTTKKIYYATLSVVKLKLIIKDSNNQKTKNVQFKEFPTKNSAKANIFINFFEDMKSQTSFATKELFKLEDLERLETVTGISIPFTSFGYTQEEALKAILENEVHVYANIQGSNIPHPVDAVPLSIKVTQYIQENVRVGNRIFYEGYTSRMSSKKNVKTIGHSFSIVTDVKTNIVNINYRPAPMLKERVKDLDFFLNVISEQVVWLGEKKLSLLPLKDKLSDEETEGSRRALEYYTKMMKVLDVLNVRQDINLTKLTDQERRDFHSLITAFIEGKPVSDLNPDLPEICKVCIGDVNMMLLFKKDREIKGTYEIYDFFNSGIAISYEDEKGKLLRTSPYSVLGKEGYIEISNVDYHSILPSYQMALIENKDIFEVANNDLLNMILAFDEGNNRNNSLLEAAKELAEWILKEDESALPNEVKTLNYLQIIRRQREFNDEEIEKVLEIIESGSAEKVWLVAAHLLLGNQAAAKINYEKLDSETQEAFKTYPIYCFFEDTERMKNNGQAKDA